MWLNWSDSTLCVRSCGGANFPGGLPWQTEASTPLIDRGFDSLVAYAELIVKIFSQRTLLDFLWLLWSCFLSITIVVKINYKAENEKLVATFLETGINNVLLLIMFIVVNNNVQHCDARLSLNSIVSYCWQLWTMWASQYCSILL